MISRYQLSPIYWLYANPISALWYALKKGISLWLKRLLEGFDLDNALDSKAIEAVAQAILIIIIIAAICATLWGIYLFLNTRHKKKHKRKILGHHIEEGISVTHFLEKGQIHAEAGDYAEAIRAEFVGLLLALETKTGLHILESWTTTEIGEGLELLTFNRLKEYQGIAILFNCWWYGPNPDLQDYHAWHNQFMLLWQEVT